MALAMTDVENFHPRNDQLRLLPGLRASVRKTPAVRSRRREAQLQLCLQHDVVVWITTPPRHLQNRPRRPLDRQSERRLHLDWH